MKFVRVFLVTSGVILAITGVVKIVSATGQARSLGMRDPFLFFTYRQIFFALGVIEMALAGYLIFGKNVKLRLAALAWLMTNFVAYRLAMWWGNFPKTCACLGNAVDWFPWLMKNQEIVMRCLLMFMLTGAYGFLWQECRREKAARQGQHPLNSNQASSSL